MEFDLADRLLIATVSIAMLFIVYSIIINWLLPDDEVDINTYIESKPKYDTSTKPFEIQIKSYLFNHCSKKLNIKNKWKHYKYYNTYQSASDATRDLRNNWYTKTSNDKYIQLNRFKIVTR